MRAARSVARMCLCAGCPAAPSRPGAGPLLVAGGGSEVRLRAAGGRASVPGGGLQAAFWAQCPPDGPWELRSGRRWQSLL